MTSASQHGNGHPSSATGREPAAQGTTVAGHGDPVVVGVDTGGTFTDLVTISENGARVHKVLSTPQAPEKAILTGIAEMGLGGRPLVLIHGSTVATNAVLEGQGARCAFVTNAGFADLLTLGRQNRPHLYHLGAQSQPVPVPADLCFEIPGRMDANGKEIEPLDDAALERLAQELREADPRAVAVCLLFSYLNDSHERRIRRVLGDTFFLTCSSEVLPLAGEYERGMATWLNAYVGPLMGQYLARLSEGLPDSRVSVMQSSAATVDAKQAAGRGVHLLLSGPAGGLAAARFLGELCEQPRLMTFDMGGTSTDVALLDGEVPIGLEGRVGPYPVAVPMVDMHTIGAGGGSLAEVDSGGLLQVGPRSAGASPGPACYGAGGGATVTDANLVLGHLPASVRLGGSMALDRKAAMEALTRLGKALELDPTQAAAGVIEVANAHMSQALRVISIERGHDPGDYALCCFGGAGSLHVCALAESLGMRRALVPIHSGVLSALGMLSVAPGRAYSRSISQPLERVGAGPVQDHFDAMEDSGRRALAAEHVASERLQVTRGVDLRYAGQSSTLHLPWDDPARLIEAFHRAHEHRFGHRLDRSVELVNLRLSVQGPRPRPALPPQMGARRARPADQTVIEGESVPVWRRRDLVPGKCLHGPLVVTDSVGTTWVNRAWGMETDEWGNLLLQRG